ncbi:MAG: DUF3800 domain-containing protein [Bacilli bacterium]|nr:DUF3800 domain-containing protein [Bacilli bacterium]
MKEINLYIDESGDLGIKGGRYFLISAIEIDTKYQKTLSRRASRVIYKFKLENNIKKSTEIKGWNLTEKQRNYLLDKILFKYVKIRYIVLDIKYTTMLLEKPDDKNACYNYLIQLLVRNLVIKNSNLEKVNLYLDNRTVKIGNRLSLKPYLYNKIVMEQLEMNENYKRIEFSVNYLESSSCYLIQWADIVANSLYKKYNKNDDRYYNKIKPYIIFGSEFPSKKFGK